MNATTKYLAAHRFGFGASDQLIEEIDIPQQWLLAQLSADSVSAELQALNLSWTSKDAIQGMLSYRKQKNQEKKQARQGDGNLMNETSSATKKQLNKQSYKLVNFAIRQAINSSRPFYWRLVDFFSNHFSVSASGQMMRLMAPTLEMEAIAPNMNGHFGDMLLAVESHPAMILYLNNEQSIGPNSKVGKRSKGKKGLNENLAREILELHTLGVSAGYNQDDVTELARAITGWSLDNKGQRSSGFLFKGNIHEPGSRQVFGKTYKSDGQQQGVNILNDLANNPKTAAYVSTKLVRHFIKDEAPQQIVDEMVKVWVKTKGHLPTVIAAMVEHPLSWSEQKAKFKTPRELVVSTCRACNLKRLRPDFIKSLTILGQQPFAAGSPAGYKDTQEYWAGPRAMMGRIEWAEHVSKSVKQAPMKIAKQALGPMLTDMTELQISRAESKSQAVTLFLMSPEFQKR